jgi:molybdenum-dependent DNA-binding transcriptional regulator ModE
MKKAEAIEALGGSIAAAAEAINVSYQAVNQWPEELPPRIADRVQAALWRMQQGTARPTTQEVTHG